MALASGTRLGHYEISGLIGAGGMGEVYRARDTRLGRTVAIKVLPSQFSGDTEFRERFEREARSISALSHPNICTLHDVGHDNGVEFLVLEHLEGETLAARLRHGPIPLAETLTIGSGIAAALEAAHRLGIVHRDLKPANVMLTKTGVKLLDFGLAKARPVAGSTSATTMEVPAPFAGSPGQPITARGTILGTFQYMAPEQIEGREADARADIFAFGAVLYEMLTGRPAFEGKSQASLIGAILKEDPPPVSRAQPLTPPALDYLVRMCLAKDPDARVQTAHDVLLHLRWVTEGSGAGAGTLDVPRQVAWRRRAAWVTGTLIVAALAVTAALLLQRVPGDPRKFRATIPLSSDAAYFFRLSPDGRTLAYSGSSGVWLLSLDAAVPRPLAGAEGGSQPFWSPDGGSVAFFADGKLKRVSAAGGPAITVSDCLSCVTGSWGTSDVILFTRQVFSPIYRVPAAGGTPVPATSLDGANGETSHVFPSFLPDGRHFLFHADGTADAIATYVGSLDGPDRARIMEGADIGSSVHFADGHLLYVRDRTLVARAFDVSRLAFAGDPIPVAEDIRTFRNFWWGRIPAFAVSDAGVLVLRTGKPESRLIWYDRAGKPLNPLGEKREYGGDLELSPDGKQLAVSVPDALRNHVWLVNTGNGAFTQFTFGDGDELGLRWSRDGSRAVYRSIRKGTSGGVYGLYENSSTGTGTEQLIVQADHGIYPDGWTPDGRSLMYEIDDAKTTWDLVDLSLTDRTTRPFVAGPGRQEYRRLSPDARWAAYCSTETGRDDVYVTTYPEGRGKWRVSPDGGWYPRWRRDGRELYYVSNDGMLVAATVEPSGATFQITQTKPLFRPRATGDNYFYDVSPDGRQFLINTPDEESAMTPLSLIVNWRAGLRR